MVLQFQKDRTVFYDRSLRLHRDRNLSLAAAGGLRPLFRRAKRASRRHAVPDARGGWLDAFDGASPARKRNRTEQEKRFGIQIDSLNDLVCFGVLPAAIGWSMDCDRLWFLATMSFFALCSLIRLAYFNVTEEERQDRTSEHRAYYLGRAGHGERRARAAFLSALRCTLP